jgi:hypothetical protein
MMNLWLIQALKALLFGWRSSSQLIVRDGAR